MAEKKYLEKRFNTWLAVLDVPKNLRAQIGRKRFVLSLETDSLAEANRRKAPVVTDWKQQIEKARKAQPDANAPYRQSGYEWFKAKQEAKGHDDEDFINSEVMDEANDLVEAGKPEAARALVASYRNEAHLIRDYIEPWLAECEDGLQTISLHRSSVKRYLEWAGAAMTVEETDGRKAGEYLSHLISNSGLARKTIGRMASSHASLWRWLASKRIVDDDRLNPWRGHRLVTKKRGRAKQTRKALTDAQVLSLLQHQHNGNAFYRSLFPDLLRIELVCGARLDELCALTKANVLKRDDGYWFKVEEGKTDAAIREVPIHSCVVPIIERRMKSEGPFLFEGLKPGGTEQKRSHEVTKTYARFRAGAGVKDRWQDFHALRNTFIAMMEGVEAPESSVKLIVGHERGSMTYGVYSKGERVKLREVINMLAYSPEVMEALANGL